MLSDTRDVIHALGGLPAVMELTGSKYGAAWYWTREGATFPSKFHHVMQRALADKGLSAPASLWGQSEPAL